MNRKEEVCMMRTLGNWVVVILLVLPLSGCSMGWEVQSKAKISDDQLFPAVSEMIEQQKDVVWPYLQEDLQRSLASRQVNAGEIVTNTLEEEQGRQYLEFCYTVGRDADIEEVVAFAHGLLNEQEQQELDEKLEAARTLMLDKAEVLSRGLAPSQRAAFWKDMQKLVTRTLVLFTAGVVYACIPTVVFWGKISAATAIAVATGVVASTVMSIWRYYQFGGSIDESFGEWLTSVTTEPELSYALAASVIAVGNTLKRGAVVTGIIICVFALYNVVDMVKPMLAKYNFGV
jgi:outer membrane lipopolysaccharide assembly protein LptE/RlpB